MLKLYNTLTRKVEEFKSLNPPLVTMYTCGPTVYDFQHIGHMRRYVGDGPGSLEGRSTRKGAASDRAADEIARRMAFAAVAGARDQIGAAIDLSAGRRIRPERLAVG